MTYDGGRGWVRDLGGNEIQVPEEGEGVSNPLTEDLDAGGFVVSGAAEVNGAAGRAIFSDGALLAIRGDDGDEGLPGTDVLIRAGSGDDENDAGASITVGGGSGAGTPGAITIAGALGADLDAGENSIVDVHTIRGPDTNDGLNVKGGPADGGARVNIEGEGGASGLPGGNVVISGGYGDATNDPGASITVGGGSGAGNAGSVEASGGGHGGRFAASSRGDISGTAYLETVPAPSPSQGDEVTIGAGDGGGGLNGGNVTIQAGSGDDGNDLGASISVGGGDGEGIAGGVVVTARSIRSIATLIGFYDTPSTSRPEVPAVPLAQDIVDALVLLGLVTQAAP